jgi:hypothetical protein
LSTFNSALSLTLIHGGAICGAVYLFTVYLASKKKDA